jgi:excisionase family DNA binding protein
MQASPATSAEVEQLYTPKEAAKIIKLSHFWLVKHAKTGLIPHHKIGRFYRFSRQDLDDIVKKMSAQPGRRPRRST